MDLSKLKPSDWLIGGGAIVFLLSLFLPWYTAEAFGVSESDSGFSYFLTGIIPFILVAAVVVLGLLPTLVESVSVPDPIGPLPKAQAVLIAAAVAAVLVLLRVIIPSDNINGVDLDSVGLSDEIDVSRSFGLFLALLAVVAVAAGAFMKFQEEEGGSSSSSQPPTPF